MLAPCLSSAAQWPQWPHSLTHDPSPSPRHFSSCASFADQSRKGTPREKTEAALVPPCLMNTENCLNSTIACSFNGKKVVDLYSASTRSVSKALGYSTHSRGITQFYLRTWRFIRKRNEPYLPLPSQPQLVLIYRPRKDGRLSRPWCEIVAAEIRTCN